MRYRKKLYICILYLFGLSICPMFIANGEKECFFQTFRMVQNLIMKGQVSLSNQQMKLYSVCLFQSRVIYVFLCVVSLLGVLYYAIAVRANTYTQHNESVLANQKASFLYRKCKLDKYEKVLFCGLHILLIIGMLKEWSIGVRLNAIFAEVTGAQWRLSTNLFSGIVQMSDWFYMFLLLFVYEIAREKWNHNHNIHNDWLTDLAGCFLIVFILLLGNALTKSKNYYFMSFAVLIVVFGIMMKRWDREFQNRHREIVVIGVMCSLAVLSRSVFYMVPQVKPMAAVIAITGAALGRRAGFMTGAISAMVSNFMFGQGPWTPWQMLAFGLVGYVAGVVVQQKELNSQKQIVEFSIIGALAVFVLYGGIMDTSTALLYQQPLTLGALLTVYATGIIFNVIHAGSTFVFIMLLGRALLKKLYRVKEKYGVFVN